MYNAGICTRMAIKVELRRGQARPTELQVVDLATQEPRSAPNIIVGEMDVRMEMEKIIRQEHSGLSGVSQTRMLVLRVRSPTVPSLDLVDLPGLVSAKRPGEPDNLAAQTEQLLGSFIEGHKQHSVFLVVIPAALPPNVAPVLGLVQKHGVEAQSIGIFTRSDGVADKELKRVVKGRLLGTAKDAVKLEPHGWIATMNAPIEDDDGNERTDLNPQQRLEMQGQEEVQWLADRLLAKQSEAAELSSRLGCNALIETMRTAFHTYVKQTWAPHALFRLEGEHARLGAANAALGLPTAHTELQGSALEELQEKAIEATERVLNQSISDAVSAAYERAAAADSAAATPKAPVKSLAALSEWAARRRAEVSSMTTQALRSAIAGVRDAMAADASPFKLGRFPAFISTVGDALEDAVALNHNDSLALVGSSSLRQLLQQAAKDTQSWKERESCAEARRQLDALAAGIAPAKVRIVELLEARDPQDILQAAKLDTRHLTTCRIEVGGWTQCRAGKESTFAFSTKGGDQEASLPWKGELRSSDGGCVVVDVHAKGDGRYEGRFTPTLAAFRTMMSGEVHCELCISLHGVLVPQSPLPVIVAQLHKEDMAELTPSEVMAAGLSIAELLSAGVSLQTVAAMGFTANALVEAGLGAGRLRDAGVDTLRLKAAGFDASQLRAVGFNAPQLKAAGFDARLLKAAGFNPSQLKAAGFDASQLRAAGLNASQLKADGFDASQLKAAGFDASQLKAAGFDASQLKAAGFDASQLKAAGFLQVEQPANAEINAFLKKVGTTLEQIKSATNLDWGAKQVNDENCKVISYLIATGAMAQLQVGWRLSALTPCLETWQARSLGLTVSFDVPFVPYADALAQ